MKGAALKNNYIRVFVSALFALIIVSGCHVSKGYETLSVYNYFDAKKNFEKGLQRNTSPAAFGLSLIYFRQDNPFHDLDSAYHYGLLAVESFETASPKKHEKWEEQLNYSLDTALWNRGRISRVFFDRAEDTSTVAAYRHFSAEHPWSPLVEEAHRRKDSLAFQNAIQTGTSKAYQHYLKRYPESAWKEEAQRRMERAQFDETVEPNNIDAYQRFIDRFPENRFAKDAQSRVYQLATRQHDLDAYAAFIRNYPGNPHIEEAWKNLYHLYISAYTKEQIRSFVREYPDFPFQKMVERDLELVGRELFLYVEDERYGFMDVNGKPQIEAQYSYASEFSNGLAAVIADKKMGYINKDGAVIIDYQYDDAQDFNQGRAVVEQNGKFGLINTTGAYVLPPEFEDIGSFAQGVFYVEDDEGFKYYSLDGELAFDEVFDEAFTFEDGLARVSQEDAVGYIRRDGTFKIKTKKGELRRYNDSLFIWELRDSMNLVNTEMQPYFDAFFTKIGTPQENRTIVEREGEYGYINRAGELVIPLKFEPYSNYYQFGQFENGHARVQRQGKFALIDSMGKNILPAIFQQIGTFGSLIPVTKGEKWGYTDRDVRLQIDYQYDYAYAFKDSVALVENDGFMGAIDQEGTVVIPLIYNQLKRLDAELFIFQKNGKEGVVAKDGTVIIPNKYQRIYEMENENILRMVHREGLDYFKIRNRTFITLKGKHG
ncbi:MAG: WG repeat-containing protein [Bacteroidota bacterium]